MQHASIVANTTGSCKRARKILVLRCVWGNLGPNPVKRLARSMDAIGLAHGALDADAWDVELAHEAVACADSPPDALTPESEGYVSRHILLPQANLVPDFGVFKNQASLGICLLLRGGSGQFWNHAVGREMFWGGRGGVG